MVKFKIINETKYLLDDNIKTIKKVLKYTLKKEKINNCVFNVILVSNKYIKELNKTYRNKDTETDVISFALEDEKDHNLDKTRLLGDIYISVDKAISQKEEYNHSLERELSFLSVHGLLHLLGYDHMNKKEEKIMFEKQELILSELKINR